MTYWIVIAWMAVVELWILRRLRFDWFIVVLVFAGTLVSVNYLAYTSVTERNYDGPAHLAYISTIAEDLRLPPVFACVACGHPPLYYALAALWSRVALAGGWMPREMGLEWFSLQLSFGFIVFALLILRSRIERTATMRLAAALVVFWPSTIINSVRVHNDALASLLMAASMYFIAQWDQQGRQRGFYAALATAALALLTKSTGYTVAATLLVFAALRLWSTRSSRESINQGTTAVIVLLSAAILAVSFRQAAYPLTLCQKVLGHACDGRRQHPVEIKPLNFLCFDVGDFVSHTSSLTQEPEQDYFLNRLAKSSLFGVAPLGEDFAQPRYKKLAVVISLTLLAMVAVCMAVLPFVRSVAWQKYRALICASAIMLAFLVAFRLRLPNPFHEDFRHIFPVLVPICLLYAKVVERLGRWSRVLYTTGVAVGLLMIVSSVAFFVH
jgi:hypothetical protein